MNGRAPHDRSTEHPGRVAFTLCLARPREAHLFARPAPRVGRTRVASAVRARPRPNQHQRTDPDEGRILRIDHAVRVVRAQHAPGPTARMAGYRNERVCVGVPTAPSGGSATTPGPACFSFAVIIFASRSMGLTCGRTAADRDRFPNAPADPRRRGTRDQGHPEYRARHVYG
jgi:hypothetical protein